MNFFDYKNLGNYLLQLCPKVVKHPVCFLSDLPANKKSGIVKYLKKWKSSRLVEGEVRTVESGHRISCYSNFTWPTLSVNWQPQILSTVHSQSYATVQRSRVTISGLVNRRYSSGVRLVGHKQLHRIYIFLCCQPFTEQTKNVCTIIWQCLIYENT